MKNKTVCRSIIDIPTGHNLDRFFYISGDIIKHLPVIPKHIRPGASDHKISLSGNIERKHCQDHKRGDSNGY
ncbi:hypothetical protein ES703_24149 [subsurface metagenome]